MFVNSRLLCRSLAMLALLLGCAITSAADVVILKDGFTIQGSVRKESETINDPFGKSPNILKADGFDYVDDGVRITIFSKNDRQLGAIAKNAQGVRPEYKYYAAKLFRRGPAHPLPFMGGTKKITEFDAKWRRKMKVIVPPNDWDLIEQQITYLDPYRCNISSPTHQWSVAYRTTEMGLKDVRKLLSMHPALAEAPGKPDPIKRIAIARFIKDAGWLATANAEIAKIKKECPAPLAKDAQEQLDKLQKDVDIAAADLLVNEIEAALAAGRYKYAEELFPLFPEKSADLREVDRVTKLMAKSKTAHEQYEKGRLSLRNLIDDVTGRGAARPLMAVGGGALIAGYKPKLASSQFLPLAAAAEEVHASLHPDSVGRIEIFVNLASQANRTKKPEELLAAAITGWAKGKNGATPNIDRAMQIWNARATVLEYQRGSTLNERNAVLATYKKQSNPIALDELTQIISLLPPAEPEDLAHRTGTLVKAGDGIPDGIYKRRTEPYGQHSAGLDYYVKLPPEYQHGRAYPVIVGIPFPGVDAEKFFNGIQNEADKFGYIVIVPDWAPQFAAKVAAWSWDGADHDFVLGALRDAIRHFTIDNDRVFLLGGGAGADMAMDVGSSHPDLFAGVIAISPNPKWAGHFDNYWGNAQKLPFYIVTGQLSIDSALNLRKVFEMWMPRGFSALHVLFRGRGFEWYSTETPVYFDWMNRKKRANSKAVLPTTPGVPSLKWHTYREGDNHFYWLGAHEVNPRNLSPNGQPNSRITPASLAGDIRGNEIRLYLRGIRTVTVWLPNDMIDWSQNIRVSINGALAPGWKKGGKKVEQDIDVLLEDYWQRGDRRMLYLAKLEFTSVN
ncbi:MAG TPA: PHB depolymerase family esterase [Urbifossiella sp.]|nr:PHB depolymerase family esterase [Urbifossiella sp.]